MSGEPTETRQSHEHDELQDSVISRLLEENFEHITGVETAWRAIDTETQYLLSDEHLEIVLKTLTEEDPEELGSYASSRAYRKSSTNYLPKIRRNVNSTIAHAKWEAQVYVWGDDETRQFLEEQEDPSLFVEDSYSIHMIRMQQNMTRLFIKAYASEVCVMQPIYNLLEKDAAQIETLVEFLTDDETPLDEYAGLLIAMARSHFDPTEETFVDSVFEALVNTPENYKNAYLFDSLISVRRSDVDDNENLTGTAQWLAILGEFAVTHSVPLQSVVDYMVSKPFDQLPDQTQQETYDENALHLKDIRQKLIDLIETYNLPYRHLLRQEPRSPRQSKKRSQGNGRATPKSSGRENVTTDEHETLKPQIDSVIIAKNGERGWQATEVISSLPDDKTQEYHEWSEIAVDKILNDKSFVGYTSKYRNRDDVRKMLHIIISDPRGNGSSIMKGQKISLVDPRNLKYPKRRTVYHFSPNDSQGVGLEQSPESNRTRIFYCISSGQLVILDIQHKTTAEKQQGVFR